MGGSSSRCGVLSGVLKCWPYHLPPCMGTGLAWSIEVSARVYPLSPAHLHAEDVLQVCASRLCGLHHILQHG